MIFLLVALQVQQHEVLFSRVATLQCAVLFAALKRTNLMFVISIRSRGLIFKVTAFPRFPRL